MTHSNSESIHDNHAPPPTRSQHLLQRSYELTVHCWRQLQRHRCEGMAAELTYRTIFSLIPVVVLGLVMFRVVGGLEDVQLQVEDQLYSFFGVPEIPESYDLGEYLDDETSADILGSQSNPKSKSALGVGKVPAMIDFNEAISIAEQEEQAKEVVRVESARQARASIRRTLSEVIAKVSSIDFKSIGVFGLLLFIYAAVALAGATEQLFNRIYDAPSKRPVHLRLAIHWSMITLGSGLLAMSLYMSGKFMAWFVTIGAGSVFQLLLGHLLSIAASWVLLFLLYALMPNTHVSVRAAAIGSLVGSLLWEFAKFGFQIYVAVAVPYSAIYGSIGLIPLFLFWIYITWLIVLFGLILTQTLQTLAGNPSRRTVWKDDVLPSGDPDWMLPIMSEIASSFDRGLVIDNQGLADRIGLSSRVVNEMTVHLVEAGLLRRVTEKGSEESLSLSRPSEKIQVSEILDLAHRVRPTSDHPAWRSLANLKLAERNAAGAKTLADLT